MEELLKIGNDGAEIESTNFWQTSINEHHKFYLSINAGAFRLLVPSAHEATLSGELGTTKEVIISRGPWPPANNKDSLELLFEDGSDCPYSIQLSPPQIHLFPNNSFLENDLIFSVWAESGKLFEFKARYRRVEHLPWLKPWNNPVNDC